MVQIDVGSETYEAYANQEDANVYLGASIHAADWNASSDDDRKGQALVSMARTLDRQVWRGVKTDPAQELAWPRTGTGIAGVEDDVVPDDIINASIEGALALFNGSTLQDDANTSQKLQSIRAGSVSLTYFRGAEGEPIRFPQIIWELVSKYLSSTSLGLGGVVSGVDGESSTNDDFGMTGGI